MNTLTLAGCALNQTPLDWVGNQRRILSGIRAAEAANVQLLCFPELAITGYGCEDAFFHRHVSTHAWAQLEALADENRSGLVVAVGLPILHEGSLYNCVAILQHGRICGLCPKQQLAGDGIHYEPRWFRPWPAGQTTHYTSPNGPIPLGELLFDAGDWRLGIEICEDAWYADRPGARHYQHNADVILSPSASHFSLGKTHIRQQLVMESSRALTCTYLYVNLVGNEAGRAIYDGETLIAQNGRLLAQNERLRYPEVQLTLATVDIDEPRRHKRRNPNYQATPLAQTQRVELSPPPAAPKAGLTKPVAPVSLCPKWEFYRAVTLGLWDYATKSRSRGFVLSLSGGADSSACAVLAAHAWQRAEAELEAPELAARLAYWPGGPQHMADWLLCVYQATENSSSETENSAQQLAQALGAAWQRWDLQPLLAGYHALAQTSLGRPLSWETDDLALQNIQARVRAPGIWLLTNLRNALLISTVNRSEAAVGYSTMDGDTAGGIAPLAGISKRFLLEWLRWAETDLPIAELRWVNALTPTAELRPSAEAQTDETDLMPYPVLERIEYLAMVEGLSAQEISTKISPELTHDAPVKLWVERFFSLWHRNQWKRERYAPSFHLDTHNLDPRSWCRYPILSGSPVRTFLE